MENFEGFIAAGTSNYKHSLLAAELLASHGGIKAPIHHYALLQPGTTWQEAFNGAFGMAWMSSTSCSRSTAPPAYRNRRCPSSWRSEVRTRARAYAQSMFTLT